jgi:hypothetical protein
MKFRTFVAEHQDGTITTFNPSLDYLNAQVAAGSTEDQALEAARQRFSASAVMLKPTAIPEQHRWCRGAWRLSGESVVVNALAAKAIAHEKRRSRREKLMAPLDKLATSPVASIKNKALSDKQAILDADAPVQTAIDAAASADALKAILQNYGAI